MTGTEAIAAILRCEGAEHLFCFPDNTLIERAAEQGIRIQMARTERTAVAMADGYARMTNGRKPAVVAVQYGPGIENSFGGVAQSYSDSTPILVFSGHVSERRLGQPPTFDPVVSFREVTKWAARINVPDRIPELMRRAFTYLRNGRPGPVLLDVPLEVAEADVDDRAVDAYVPVRRARSAADPADVAAATDTLLAAERPLVHAGQGVLYAEATDELLALAELLELPVMTTLPGKSAFPEDHPLSVGAGGRSGRRLLAQALEETDVLLAVGASLTTSLFAAPIPAGKRVIQLTVDERDLNKDYPATHFLVGDAKLVLGQLLEEIHRRLATTPRAPTAAAERIASRRDEDDAEWLPRLKSAELPLSPYRVIWELMQAVEPAETVITHDSGRPRDQLAPFWMSTTPRGYLGWGKSTHLGWGLGLALGAKLAAPEKLVVNVMGDSAIGMVGMDIETASRLGIAILTIVLNNSSMSFYERAYPVATERYGLKYLTGDYAAVARALGAHAERVVQPDEIRPAIARARERLASGQPALLEMITKEEPEVARYW